MKEVIQKRLEELKAEYEQINTQRRQVVQVAENYSKRMIEIEGSAAELSKLLSPEGNTPKENEVQDNKSTKKG